MKSFNDVNQAKLDLINRFMKEYKDSKDKLLIVSQYEDVLKTITPLEIFCLDEYSDLLEYPIANIKTEAGKFINLFHQGLQNFSWNRKCSPLMEHFLRENEAIKQHLMTMKEAVKNLSDEAMRKRLSAALKQLSVIEHKFIKLQNIPFPVMEHKVPSTRPLKVLWSLQDDTKALIKGLIDHLSEESIDFSLLKRQIGEFYFLVMGLLQKEELILFPVASMIITDEEWVKMYQEASTYPAVMVDEIEVTFKNESNAPIPSSFFQTITGNVSFQQLDLIFKHLPIDLTFVDEDNRVRYYNETKERIFPRTPQVIGRSVELCHPPKSVHIVNRIIEAFRNGSASQAEFWLEHHGRFLYIVYYALRDEENNYKGVLEVTLDATHIRSLQGQKRLLDW